ncbi:MAG: tetratricopeptide repeat protein [Candidatus Thorarchaeota archaeon]
MITTSPFKLKKIEEMSSAELLEEGSKSFHSKSWKKAMTFLIPYVEKNPSDTEAKKLLAQVFLALGRPNDAAAIHESLLHHNTENAYTIGLYGVALLKAGDKDRGIGELKRSLAMANNEEFRGHLYKAQGRKIKILEYGAGGIRKLVGQAKVRGWEELLVVISVQCRGNKAMVRVSDILDALSIDMIRLKELISSVESLGGIKASFVKIDRALLLEFGKPNAVV